MLHSEERWDLLGREGAKAHEISLSSASVGGEAKSWGSEQKEERHIACDNSFATLRHVLVARLPKAVFGFDSNLATSDGTSTFLVHCWIWHVLEGGGDAAARPLVSSGLVSLGYSSEIVAVTTMMGCQAVHHRRP